MRNVLLECKTAYARYFLLKWFEWPKGRYLNRQLLLRKICRRKQKVKLFRNFEGTDDYAQFFNKIKIQQKNKVKFYSHLFPFTWSRNKFIVWVYVNYSVFSINLLTSTKVFSVNSFVYSVLWEGLTIQLFYSVLTMFDIATAERVYVMDEHQFDRTFFQENITIIFINVALSSWPQMALTDDEYTFFYMSTKVILLFFVWIVLMDGYMYSQYTNKPIIHIYIHRGWWVG